MTESTTPPSAGACVLCGADLGSSDNLRAHLSDAHGAVPMTDESDVPANADLPAPEKVEAGRRTSKKAALVVGIVLVVGGSVAAVLISGGSSKESTPGLQAAMDACATSNGIDKLSIADNGKTVIVDTGSKYGSVEGLVCVWREIATPQSVIAEVEQTTALNGVRHAAEDGFDYSWSYHPDNGLNMVIKDVGRTK